MELIIKNMVCGRCEKAVRHILNKNEVQILHLQLGKVEIAKPLTDQQKQTLQKDLISAGFELLDDQRSKLVNEIKSIIIDQIHYQEEGSVFNFSTLLTQQLPFDYTYLSRLFSAVEGRTIEQFTLMQKIEKVKELLTYEELSLKEIAFRLNYSSTAHLSAQFKKIMGMTPTAFKQWQQQERKALDEV